MQPDLDRALDLALDLVQQLRAIKAATQPAAPVTMYRSADDFARECLAPCHGAKECAEQSRRTADMLSKWDSRGLPGVR